MLTRLVVLGSVCLAVSATCVAGAARTEIPKGWWKGTIALNGQWDFTTPDGQRRLRGSGTLRINRTAPDRAEYDLADYMAEASWTSAADVPAECREQVYYRKTASGRKSGGISVSVREARPSGVEFVVSLGVEFPAQEERPLPGGPCDLGGQAIVRPNGFPFVSRRSVGSRSHSGSAVVVADPRAPWRAAPVGWPDVIGGSPTPGGVNRTTATFELAVVGPKGPVTTGRVVLDRPRPSLVAAVLKVRQGGQAARIRSGSCAWWFPSLGGGPRMWPPSIAAGEIVCTTALLNARYIGERLAGQMAFKVGTTRVSRKFSVVVGPGKSLRSPKGAVIKRRAR
jgi:hypothetical protein